jgi:NAD(P)-dependent dehydrogenase (short-subunit alcohol dehydrogenase family)
VDLALDFQLQLVFMNLNKLYIIGGASSGLGHEYAKNLSKKFKVIGLYNKSIQKNSKNIKFYKINLEQKNEILLFFKNNKKYLNQYKKIIFVNFATYKKDDLLINLKEKDIKKTFGVNLFSNFFFTSCLIKNYKNKILDIVFISSSLGLKVDAGTLLYSSSKMGLESLMKSIVIEYSNFNIKCNILVLGFFNSPLWEKLSKHKQNKIKNLIPNGKIGNIKNITQTLSFLEKNNYINSSSIFLDAGFGTIKV